MFCLYVCYHFTYSKLTNYYFFYKLFNTRTHTAEHKGPQKWDKLFETKTDVWEKRFASLKTLCKEPKLKEFQFKFMHRIVVTKRELFRYGIQSDDDCVYCGEGNSIDHTFSDCAFIKKFSLEVINWFNVTNKTHFNPPYKRNCSALHPNNLE